ncbi:MAG: VWA domain-containing protein [Alphaproteobacteria bacterium]|nr:VWA domain-containing protein [Alphaproteobacteria bacterium]MCY4499896.1 VWA domain-containing protein [Rhodospirillaceae bacterium]
MTDQPEEQGRFAQNIVHFGRVLRAAGLPVGPGKIIDATRAVEAAGITSRDDFYWTLHSVFVNRRDQREIFDQAFHVFWRNPKILERMMSLMLPTIQADGEAEHDTPSRRLLDALFPGRGEGGDDEESGEIVGDAAGTYSQREILQSMDFESMSADEVAEAKAIISRMRLPIMQVPTRRFAPDPRGGRIDMRATLRSALRSGTDTIPLKRSARRQRHPPLVVLCDISGSMSRYSRMLLHFLHTITNDRDRVFTFVFGTRLTNITRFLRYRDVDVALEKVAENVEDWSGGTRIGRCVKEFNAHWSRRVLGQGALVLLISDGLDRDSGEGLEAEIERLHKSCRRLIWLNPLLRYEGFEPKSLGVRAILPHVDEFRTVHNLQSLRDVAQALAREMPRTEEGHMDQFAGERAA